MLILFSSCTLIAANKFQTKVEILTIFEDMSQSQNLELSEIQLPGKHKYQIFDHTNENNFTRPKI